MVLYLHPANQAPGVQTGHIPCVCVCVGGGAMFSCPLLKSYQSSPVGLNWPHPGGH